MPQPEQVPDFLARDMVRKFKQAELGGGSQRALDVPRRDLLDGKLGELRMPTLIIWGKQDHSLRLRQRSRCMGRFHNPCLRSMTAVAILHRASVPAHRATAGRLPQRQAAADKQIAEIGIR